MNPYRFAISLRFKHPSIDPAEITRTVLIEPYRAWRAGEPHTTPDGKPLEGTNRETYWTSGDLIKGRSEEGALVAKIDALAVELSAHRDFFRRVRSEGGWAELFVGWYFTGNSGDVFSASLLSKLGDMGLNLSLDVYPPDQPQNSF